MRKSTFALRLAALFALIGFASACAASLIFAYFFYRDPSRMLVAAQKYFPAYAAASLGVFVFFRAALDKAQKEIGRIDAGESLSLEERLAVRARLALLPRYATLANGICFGLIPLGLVISWIATGQGDLSEDLLTLLFFAAIGLSCSSQQLATGELLLREERAKLGIRDIEGIRRDMRTGTRLLYTSLTSVFLTGISLIVAAMGIYREYARWVSSQGADAVSSASKAQYGGAEGTVLLQLLLLAALTIAWSAVGAVLSTRNLRGQLENLESRMLEIASGGSDLGQRASVGHNDDVGRLGSAFNKVLDKVQALLRSVRGTSASVSESSHRLDEYVAQAEASLASFEEASGRVSGSAESQAQAVGRGKEIVARLSASIEKIAADVQTQASQVSESSASVEEMAANIASVNKSAEKAGELTVSLSRLSDSGLEVVRDTLKGMAEIREASASVRDIIGSISRIASQTNLLAMNAAIEAAHAGAAGSGFAVVANEVRGLAETSAKSSKEIVGLMKAMEAKIADGSKRAEKAEAAFSDIAAAVGGTGEIVQSIVSAMAEQGEAAREILLAMKGLTEATTSIESQAKSQESNSAEITAAIEDIVRKAQAIEESIQEQTGSLQALGRVVRKVSEESGVNKAGVESLDASVGGFTA